MLDALLPFNGCVSVNAGEYCCKRVNVDADKASVPLFSTIANMESFLVVFCVSSS